MHWLAALSHPDPGRHRPLHRPAVLRDQRRDQRSLPDGVDPLPPFRRRRRPGGDGDRPVLLALRRQPVRALAGAVPGPSAGLGEPGQAGEVLPHDPAGEGAPLSRPQPAPAAELHGDVRRWRCCRSSPGSRCTASRIRAASSSRPSAGSGRCSAGCRSCASSTTWRPGASSSSSRSTSTWRSAPTSSSGAARSPPSSAAAGSCRAKQHFVDE